MVRHWIINYVYISVCYNHSYNVVLDIIFYCGGVIAYLSFLWLNVHTKPWLSKMIFKQFGNRGALVVLKVLYTSITLTDCNSCLRIQQSPLSLSIHMSCSFPICSKVNLCIEICLMVTHRLKLQNHHAHIHMACITAHQKGFLISSYGSHCCYYLGTICSKWTVCCLLLFLPAGRRAMTQWKGRYSI